MTSVQFFSLKNHPVLKHRDYERRKKGKRERERSCNRICSLSLSLSLPAHKLVCETEKDSEESVVVIRFAPPRISLSLSLGPSPHSA